MSKYKILLSFFFLAVGLNGQEVLTLETVKSLASKNNLEVGLGKLSAQSAAMQVYRANAGLTPRIDWNLNTNGAYNKVNQEFIDGRTIDRYGRTFAPNTNVLLSWTLYDGKKMQTRYEILKKQSEFAAIQAGQTEDNVVFAAMELFYTLSRQKELIKYLRRSLPYYEERLKITEERWKIGRGSKLDFLQSQNDHNTQKSAIQNEELNFINQKAMLNLMLNRPADLAFDIEEVARSTAEYAYEAILKGAVANSEILKLLDKNIEINKLSIRDLKGNDLPRIGWTTSLGYNFSTTNAGQILLSRNLGLNAGFSASWNLYDGGHNRKQIEIARQTTSILEAQKELELSRIKSDITLVLNQLSATKSNLALEEENKVLAEENLEIALEKFKLGSSTILELNDAQQRYDNAINRFVNATYAVYFAELQAKQIINIP